jgi:hypothetical protein
MQHITRNMALGAVALAIATASAGAQGKGKGKGHQKAAGSVMTGAWPKQQRTQVSGGDIVIVRPDRKVPPGLAKKPGQMPPGQYKKLYSSREGATMLGDVFGRHGYVVTRIVPVGTSQYVYYRRPDGTLVRAIVSPGTERLRFTNVPSLILNELIARLY